MTRVVVLGAGVAGLATAIALGRAGQEVTIVERDEPPPAGDGDTAFARWDRRHVPQFRQGHIFTARARTVLLERAPEVVERLVGDGIEEVNLFKLLAPPELHRPEDDAFTALLVRRPPFELALRRVAEATPAVQFRDPESASGLVLSTDRRAVRVRGLQLAGGDVLESDVLIDSGGRRSPVVRWLREAGATITEDIQDCGVTYYSRYFRQRPESDLSQALLYAIRGEVNGMFALGFGGDHGTYGLAFAAPPWDEQLKVLRHSWAWEAMAAAIPRVAPWADPDTGQPLQDVETMAGHQNVRRRFVAGGEPAALGVLPVGDSLCTTNPTYGWGASMAITHAFAAVDAIQRLGDDPVQSALAYDETIRAETNAVFDESSAMDRLRSYRWRNEPLPDHERDEAERQALISEGIGWGALRDPDLGRALLRRINLLEPPAVVLDDPTVRTKAQTMRALFATKHVAAGPDRAGLLAAIERARPA
jgi:2-polyprenyl-6-methoxyphenol hydroxylase-like FAD-dependent oxidoreductase